MSEDPIGLAGGINFYAYVGNSPVNWVDPEGKMSAIVGGVIAVAAGGAIVGFTACMFNCMGGTPADCRKTNPLDRNWDLKFGKCTEICVHTTTIWQFLIDPYGPSVTTVIENTNN